MTTEKDRERTIFDLISAHRGALMGFAALWIIVFHVWRCLLGGVPVLGAAERFVVHFGYYGVDIFFFLSGMGLVFSIEKHPLPVFYYNRFKKLVLPYFGIAFIRMAVERWSLKRLVGALAGYFFFAHSIYLFMWFVYAIGIFYLLFPLYYGGMKRSGRPVRYTLVVLAVWLVLTLLVNSRMRLDLFGFTDRIPVFLLGILLGVLGREGRLKYRRWMLPVAALLLAAGLFLSALAMKEKISLRWRIFSSPIANLLTALPLCLLLAALFDRFGRALSGLIRVLKFYGGFSLEFYCVQELYARHILIDWLQPLPAPLFNLAAIALATALGWLAWRLSTALWKRLDARILPRLEGK